MLFHSPDTCATLVKKIIIRCYVTNNENVTSLKRCRIFQIYSSDKKYLVNNFEKNCEQIIFKIPQQNFKQYYSKTWSHQ